MNLPPGAHASSRPRLVPASNHFAGEYELCPAEKKNSPRIPSACALSIALLAGPGCADSTELDSSQETETETGAAALELDSVAVTPSPFNHLAVEVTALTSAPAQITVEIIDDEGRTRTFVGGEDLTTHAVRGFGLRAEVEHEIRIRAQDSAGEWSNRSSGIRPDPCRPSFHRW